MFFRSLDNRQRETIQTEDMRSVYRWDIQNWTHTKGDCIVIEGENKQPGERRAVSHGTMWTGCVKKKKKKK